MTRGSISRIFLGISFVFLLLGAIVMSPPGERVGWFCIAGLLAIPSIVVGVRRYRLFGIIVLLIAIGLGGYCYYAGRLKDEVRQEREAMRVMDEMAVVADIHNWQEGV